jgi:hypothetical protein
MGGNRQGESLAPQLLRCAHKPEKAASRGSLSINQHLIHRRMVIEERSSLGSGKDGERRRREPTTELRD